MANLTPPALSDICHPCSRTLSIEHPPNVQYFHKYCDRCKQKTFCSSIPQEVYLAAKFLADKRLEVFQKGIDVLKKVREGYPDAIIGGGFLRDLVLGKDPKDIDIFTFLPPVFGEESIIEEPYVGNQLVGLWKRGEFFLPIDIIQLNPEVAPDLASHVHLFAFGIQQIWYDGQDVQVTEAFQSDVDSKRFTVLRCESQGEAEAIARKWRDRFHPKFPDFKFAIGPEINEEYHLSLKSLHLVQPLPLPELPVLNDALDLKDFDDEGLSY